jgi:hypothetical protein
MQTCSCRVKAVQEASYVISTFTRVFSMQLHRSGDFSTLNLDCVQGQKVETEAEFRTPSAHHWHTPFTHVPTQQLKKSNQSTPQSNYLSFPYLSSIQLNTLHHGYQRNLARARSRTVSLRLPSLPEEVMGEYGEDLRTLLLYGPLQSFCPVAVTLVAAPGMASHPGRESVAVPCHSG